MLARRDTGVKEGVAWDDVAARVPELLEQIQVKPELLLQSAVCLRRKFHEYQHCLDSCKDS